MVASFKGFPAGSLKSTPLPNLLFSELLPHVDSLAELKVTLHVFWLLYQKKGFPRFATLRELLADGTLLAGMKGGEEPPDELVRAGLRAATERGTLLHLTLELKGADHEVYFLNTANSRNAIARLRSGELDLGHVVRSAGETESVLPQTSNIFTLYEENVGLLTPLIAEELIDAEKLYPASWIKDAFRQAVGYNKRRWAYIKRILERWALEGRGDEEDRGASRGVREHSARYAPTGSGRRR